MLRFLFDEFEHVIMWDFAIGEEAVDRVLFISIGGERGVKIERFAS